MTSLLLGMVAVLLCVAIWFQWRILRRDAAKVYDSRPKPKPRRTRVQESIVSSPTATLGTAADKQQARPEWVQSIRSLFFRAEQQEEPPVELLASPASVRKLGTEYLEHVRASSALRGARWILAEPLARRSDLVTIDCRRQSVAMRYMVDGVWHNAEPLERGEVNPALAALKALCGLDPAERAGQFRGECIATCRGTRYNVTLAGQCREGDDRTVLQFAGPSSELTTYEQLGLRGELQERLCQMLAHGSGLILLSSLPANGLRTTVNAVLHRAGQIARTVTVIEREEGARSPVKAVEVRTCSGSPGQSPIAVFAEVFTRMPHLVVLRDLADGPTVDSLCEHLEREPACAALSIVRAKDCAESLARVLMLRVDRARFAREVTAVLNQRLIRKLCERCKQPYTPDVELLRRLRLPSRQDAPFYQRPKRSEHVCSECGGLGYRGRTGLFELLRIDDTIRRALANQPNLESIRKAVYATGTDTLSSEGLLLVQAGVTSLSELVRVLKLSPAKEDRVAVASRALV